MVNYIYDGTFEGLLTSIHEAYYRHEAPNKITTDKILQENFFESNVQIDTDLEKFKKVYTSIKEKISSLSLKYVYYIYLSEHDDAGTIIYDYLKFGWKKGNKIDLYLSDDRVLKVHNLSQKVMGESHRILGLLRFKQIDTTLYYAQMSPDYNILCLIAPHFANRLSDQNWIIYDTKRNLAAIFNQKEWIITEFDAAQFLTMSEIETDYQNLWKQYFKNITISNRLNPKLQRKNMPARYWKHLVEMEGHST